MHLPAFIARRVVKYLEAQSALELQHEVTELDVDPTSGNRSASQKTGRFVRGINWRRASTKLSVIGPPQKESTILNQTPGARGYDSAQAQLEHEDDAAWHRLPDARAYLSFQPLEVHELAQLTPNA